MEGIFDFEENSAIDFITCDINNVAVKCAIYGSETFVSFSDALKWASSNAPSFQYKHLEKKLGKAAATRKLRNISNNWLRNSALGKLIFVNTDGKVVEFPDLSSLKFLFEYVCDVDDTIRFLSAVIDNAVSESEETVEGRDHMGIAGLRDSIRNDSSELRDSIHAGSSDLGDSIHIDSGDLGDSIHVGSSAGSVRVAKQSELKSASVLSSNLSESSTPETLDSFLNKLSPTDWNKVAEKFGKFLNPKLFSLSFIDQVSSMEELSNVPPSAEWYQKVPEALRILLQCCTETARPRKRTADELNRLVNMVEAILKGRNQNYNSPYDLQENTVNLTLTGSRLSTNLLGAAGTGGGYTKVCKMLKRGAGELEPRGDGFKLDVIDNDGEFNKKYSLLRHNLKFCDVVTCHITIKMPFEMGLLKNPALSPAVWFQPQLLAPDTEKLLSLKTTSTTSRTIFNLELKRLFDEELKLVKSKNKIHEGISVPAHLKESRVFISEEAGSQSTESTGPTSKKLTVEIQDGVAYVFVEDSEDLEMKSFREKVMSHVKSSIASDKPSVSVRDIIFENPSSIPALTKILLKVMEDAGYPVKVKTVLLFMDGNPYVTCLGILQNTFTCVLCGENFYGENTLNAHFINSHPSSTAGSPKGVRTFEDILLMSGPGHVYMNLQKSILEIIWPVFGEEVAKALGFESISALNMVKNAKDTHITHEVLLVVRHAVMSLLVEAYVDHLNDCDVAECGVKGESFEGFKFFLNTHIKDPNFMLCFELLISMVAIHILLLGIRRNNVDYYLCGLEVGGPIFFARKHPKYRAITLLFRLLFLIAPDELQTPLKEIVGISNTADPTRGEGADFILEGINQGVKNLLPNGVSSEQNWMLAARNYRHVTKMRGNVFARLGYKDPTLFPEDKIKTRDQYQERISVVKKTFGDYLNKPSVPRTIQSLSGTALSSSMKMFQKSASESLNQFVDKIIKNNLTFYEIASAKSDIVPITKEEETFFNSWESKTVVEIESHIDRTINDISEVEIKTSMRGLYKEHRKNNKRKDGLIEFVHKLPKLESDLRKS